ncbi:hypothetical protein [Clostridium perfringens]|uniref:Uncharacterized protein n=1 Tax=Clostridium perfringens TaxID=1502 RepID=A0A140GR87_CLOPF|nr:hypothetical protein [Clostridium perfringens]AMN31046.1 hypothetical protein JFP838_pA0130 [Clostridium perfringens]
MKDLERLSKEELLEVVKEYDRYIQDANEEDLYIEGWKPVCVEEFYNNDFQELKNK